MLTTFLLLAFVATQAPAEKSKTVWDGAFTAAQAMRGKAVFEVQCATCHSKDLSGDSAPPLKGTVFIDHWREDNVNSLFTRVRTTMPRRNPGTLTPEMYLDVVAFLLEANGYPAGEAELKTDALKSFLITDKDGPTAVPDFALVQMVGCLTQNPDKSWTLTNADEPKRTRNPGQPEEPELKASADKPLGTDTYKLLYVDSFRTGFNPDSFQGHKMEAKGFLIRKPDLRLSVTWLESVAPNCPAR